MQAIFDHHSAGRLASLIYLSTHEKGQAIFSVCDSCSFCEPDTDSYLSSEDELETSWGQKSGSYVEEPPERKTFPTLVQVCCVCGGRVGV